MEDNLFFRLARSQSFDLSGSMKILDFGCGEGDFVDECLAAGYDAWGCDILIEDDQERLKAIRQPYALPFDDDAFDFIISDQVFEHVQNPEVACAEIARVLRPGGISIHVFPSRYRLIEPHVYVPLAPLFRPSWWLSLWARLGVRNEFQKGLPAQEVQRLNQAFLADKTNYLTRRQIRDAFVASFDEVSFIEDGLMQTSRRIPRFVKSLAIPALSRTYSEVYQRIVLAK